MKESIKKGNKILAEFLGWQSKSYPSYMKTPFHGRDIWWSPSGDGKTRSYCCVVGEELFHESWEWLMSVVTKIEKENMLVEIVNYDYSRAVSKEVSEKHKRLALKGWSCEILSNIDREIYHDTQVSSESRIKAVWKACVEFAKKKYEKNNKG